MVGDLADRDGASGFMYGQGPRVTCCAVSFTTVNASPSATHISGG